jgi:hypothetical protein
MTNYTKCLNCQSDKIMPDLAVEDAGAYPSGSHRVSVDKGFSDRLLNDVIKYDKGGTSLIRAYVCVDCGFTALFAQSLEKLTGS